MVCLWLPYVLYMRCIFVLQVLIYPKVTPTNDISLKSYQEYKDGPMVGIVLIDWSV